MRLPIQCSCPQAHPGAPDCIPQVLCDQVLHQKFLNELLVRHGCAGQPCPQQQGQQELPGQQQQVPCSHIAELLRRDVSQQIQQVLKMTAADWLHMFADLFPKVCRLVGAEARGLFCPAVSPLLPAQHLWKTQQQVMFIEHTGPGWSGCAPGALSVALCTPTCLV